MTDEPKLNPVDPDQDAPATKGDIQTVKEELAELVVNSLESVATNKDIERLETRIETQIAAEGQSVRDHMTALIEEVREDVGGANRDEISLIKNQKIPDHEKRITALEQRAGVA